MKLVGIGYRRQLSRWIDARPPEIGCLEITAEHFFDSGKDQLRALACEYPLFVHGLGLSLGTPGPLDQGILDNFARVVEVADPEWISEHVAFTRSSEVDLGHLNPIQPTDQTLEIMSEHALEVSKRCGKRLILENITSHLQLAGDMSEPEFLNRLCQQSGCGVLLDVTNLFINSKNHGFDPRTWLYELDPQNIVQLHVVGYSIRGGRWEDFHAEPIQPDLWDLIHEVLEYTPVQAVIIERDSNFPNPDELAQELRNLEAALTSYGFHNCTDSSTE